MIQADQKCIGLIISKYRLSDIYYNQTWVLRVKPIYVQISCVLLVQYEWKRNINIQKYQFYVVYRLLHYSLSFKLLLKLSAFKKKKDPGIHLFKNLQLLPPSVRYLPDYLV